MITGNGKNDGSMVMIFRIYFILIASIMLLGCPCPSNWGDRVYFSASHIPPAFDSIRVEVYDLQDSLILFQIDTIYHSAGYFSGSYEYNSDVTTNLKISIHCANGWQSFQPIEAVPKNDMLRQIIFFYDGTDEFYDSKRILAEPIGNICEIPDSAVFIIRALSCY